MRFPKCQHLFEKKGIFLAPCFWLDEAVFSVFLKIAQKNLYFFAIFFFVFRLLFLPLTPLSYAGSF